MAFGARPRPGPGGATLRNVIPTQSQLDVPSLGEARFDSPLRAKGRHFPDPDLRVRYQTRESSTHLEGERLTFEKAGPRERLYFDPSTTTAAFVTCGGLAPGLNNTIRSGFYELLHNYGVERVLGIQSGYRGLDPASGLEPIELTSHLVDAINDLGGTILGSSRGGREPEVIADYLEAHDIDILFCIGGDGTMLHAVHLLDGAPVPLLGVNLGRLGYLTEIEPDADHIHAALIRFDEGAERGAWRLDQRMMLDVEAVDHEGVGVPRLFPGGIL